MIELVCVVCGITGKTTGSDADAERSISFMYDETNPLASKNCPVCKSTATVAVDIFKRFALARAASTDKIKTSPAPTARPDNSGFAAASEQVYPDVDVVATSARAVVDKHLAEQTSKILRDSMKWAAHADATRKFLIRGGLVLSSANLWWDGYHFYSIHSWDAGVSNTVANDALDYTILRLVNKNGMFRDLLFYVNPEDEGMLEVSDEQK